MKLDKPSSHIKSLCFHLEITCFRLLFKKHLPFDVGFRKWSWRLEVHICGIDFGLEDWMRCLHTRWWFKYCFYIFTPTWGKFPFWLIFSKWVETTNQHIMFTVYCFLGMLLIQRCHGHQQFCDKGLQCLSSNFDTFHCKFGYRRIWASWLKQDSPEFTCWCLFDLAVL